MATSRRTRVQRSFTCSCGAEVSFGRASDPCPTCHRQIAQAKREGSPLPTIADRPAVHAVIKEAVGRCSTLFPHDKQIQALIVISVLIEHTQCPLKIFASPQGCTAEQHRLRVLAMTLLLRWGLDRSQLMALMKPSSELALTAALDRYRPDETDLLGFFEICRERWFSPTRTIHDKHGSRAYHRFTSHHRPR